MFDSNASETALFAAPKAYNPLEANHLIPNHSHPSVLDAIFSSSPQLSLSLSLGFEQDYFESTLVSFADMKNDFGVTGIAYDAQIMPVKVLGDDGRGAFLSVANGIRYAVDNGANVLNLSLGGPVGSSELEAAVEYASSKGAIVVMAAGNDGDSTTMGHFSAVYATNWGLAVGAVDQYNQMASFSNRAGGEEIAYVNAPGVSVYSTFLNNNYPSLSGTSMATPHVTGVVALMLSANGSLTDGQVRQIITGTAENPNSLNISNSNTVLNNSAIPLSHFSYPAQAEFNELAKISAKSIDSESPFLPKITFDEPERLDAKLKRFIPDFRDRHNNFKQTISSQFRASFLTSSDLGEN